MAEANLRYYSGYAKLTREYFDELAGSIQGARKTPTSSGGVIGAAPTRRKDSPSPPPAMALEGKLGTSPVGAFVVENGLARVVRAPLLASSFRGPGGAEISLPLTFDPEEIDLAPGDQVLVRVTAPIEEGLEPGAQYRGDVTVPGLPGTRVGLVIRRDPQD